MRVGTIVRVPLHGRRVRGWVVADDVVAEADAGRLLAITKVVSAGPPPDVVALCEWTAWRYAGPTSLLLRTASAPNVVAANRGVEVATAIYPTPPAPDHVAALRDRDVGVLAWPPAVDRREVVLGLLAAEGSTVVVVPDSSRVALLARQLEREGRSVVEMGADAPDAERTERWDRARAGACVVVGGRVAVFAPVPDLAAIVVLDDGDEALVEERAPSWNAREVALERARRAGARVAIVGPVSTVESSVRAGGTLRPPRTTERAGWSRLEVVDPRDEPPGRALWSTPLTAALQAVVAEGTARSVCVLNRRGRARLLACRACGELARCEQCGAAVGEGGAGLQCRRCGATRPRVCPRCASGAFRPRRIGVTGLRDELSALLPRARVAEVDASTTVVPEGADVLIGTEAVLHRAGTRRPVALCAFLEFDQELLATRYRAAEQALWLLARAARLVGPRGGAGRVLVQTRVVDHEVIDAAVRAEPTLVTEAEQARRRALGFPPFGGLAEVSGAHVAVEPACDLLRARPELTVLGPVVAGVSARALVQAPSVDALCDQLAAVHMSGPRARGRLRVDVDPQRV